VRVCGFACACGVRVRWSARAASSPVALVWPFPGFLAVAPCMPSAFWGLFLGPRWPMCGSASLRAWVSFGSVWGGYSWSLFGASLGPWWLFWEAFWAFRLALVFCGVRVWGWTLRRIEERIGEWLRWSALVRGRHGSGGARAPA